MLIVGLIMAVTLSLLNNAITTPIKDFFLNFSNCTLSQRKLSVQESNEFNRVLSVYGEILEQHEATSKILNQMSRYAMTSLLSDLLYKKADFNNLEINRILQEIDTHFVLNAPVIVLVISEKNNERADKKAESTAYYNAHVDANVHRCCDNSEITYHIFNDSLITICVLQEIVGWDDSILLQRAKQVTVAIEAVQLHHGQKLICAYGTIQHTLCDIALSYHKAKLELYCKIYDNSNLMPISALDCKNENQYWCRLFEAQFRRYNLLNPVFALQDLYTVIDNCAEAIKSCEVLIKTYYAFYMHLVSVLNSMFINKNKISEFKDKFDESFEMDVDYESMTSHIKAACAEAYRLMSIQLSKRQNKYIRKTLDFISENYSNCNLNLNMIASELRITQTYLSTLFNDCMCVNFSTYLNFYRIDQAKNLMLKSHILVKDIGKMVGFGSTQTFINAFKKQTGKTPKQWLDENVRNL